QWGGGLDRGMRQVAGRVVLEEGRAHLQVVGSLQASGRGGSRVRGRESLRRLDDGRVGGESPAGEEGGEKPRRGGSPRVQGLRHGPEAGFETGGPRPSEAESPGPPPPLGPPARRTGPR